jgi:hypothetical protein
LHHSDDEASSDAGGVLTMKSLALPKNFEDNNGDGDAVVHLLGRQAAEEEESLVCAPSSPRTRTSTD